MRALTLLFMFGIILEVSPNSGSRDLTGISGHKIRPFEGTNGTINSTVVPQPSNETVAVQWNGIIKRVDGDFGLPPTELEEDTKGNTQTQQKKTEEQRVQLNK